MQKFEYFFPLSLSVSVCLRADFIWLVGNSKLAAVKFVHFLSVARRRKNWCCWWNIPSHSVSSLHIPTIERPFVHQKKNQTKFYSKEFWLKARAQHTHIEKERYAKRIFSTCNFRLVIALIWARLTARRWRFYALHTICTHTHST